MLSSIYINLVITTLINIYRNIYMHTMITLKDCTFSETSKKEVFDFLVSHPRYCNRRLVSIHFKKLMDDMNSSLFLSEFESFTFVQKFYHYLQDDFELLIGKCQNPNCKNRCKFISFSFGYNKYCTSTCSNRDPKIKEMAYNTRLKKNNGKYVGDEERIKRENAWKNKSEEEKNNIKNKQKQTLIERYGVESIMQCEEFKDKLFRTIKERYGGIGLSSPDIRKKQEQSMIDRYGVRHNWQSKDELLNGQKTREELYGNKNYVCTDMFLQYMKDNVDERIEKINNTKKKKGSFNTSGVEEKLNEYLLSINISFYRQYKDERYPYSCDFYFPDMDLFLELNALWTHGGKPFEGSENDMKLVEYWESKGTQYYLNAIENWTVRDVEKRETAKRNKLNYIEIFSNDIDDIINELKKYNII